MRKQLADLRAQPAEHRDVPETVGVVALQQLVGHDIRRGKTRAVKGQPGRYNIIYGYVDENVGLTAGRLAVRLAIADVHAGEGALVARGEGAARWRAARRGTSA